MAGWGSPCGACKFLRRKCLNGCVFAPYFCHDQGASTFAAIHKIFGASNVSKLLTHLPESERSEAAVTISYEAQARLQDPIYGCVSEIFALQEQVVNLQAQLASLKELAVQCFPNQSENSETFLKSDLNITKNFGNMNLNSIQNHVYPVSSIDNITSAVGLEFLPPMESLEMKTYERQSGFENGIDELSVALGYIQHSEESSLQQYA